MDNGAVFINAPWYLGTLHKVIFQKGENFIAVSNFNQKEILL